MKQIILALALCLPLTAQPRPKPFSQPWDFSTTKPWSPMDCVVPGAMVGVFANIYCDQRPARWYWRLLIPFFFGLGYEVYRWAEGKRPLAMNVVYEAAGGATTTFVWKVRF